MERQRSIPDWNGTLSSLKEVLDDVAFTIQMGEETGVRPDILTLEAFDVLDRYISLIKLEMGL